ncbi:hypothetical protein HGRIS_006670 [Hohenbuehelia grisea]|uniref:Uncharacterized protein n=1 Tax=Hohenbuehelia grisea TaxID=104357 RepID=A0ABR3J9Q2_9AGAR
MLRFMVSHRTLVSIPNAQWSFFSQYPPWNPSTMKLTDPRTFCIFIDVASTCNAQYFFVELHTGYFGLGDFISRSKRSSACEIDDTVHNLPDGLPRLEGLGKYIALAI